MKSAGRATYWFVPFKVKASPTSPGANPAPFSSAPLLFPKKSSALPSPVYQATIPGGGGVHGCAWAAPRENKKLNMQSGSVRGPITNVPLAVKCRVPFHRSQWYLKVLNPILRGQRAKDHKNQPGGPVKLVAACAHGSS